MEEAAQDVGVGEVDELVAPTREQCPQREQGESLRLRHRDGGRDRELLARHDRGDERGPRAVERLGERVPELLAGRHAIPRDADGPGDLGEVRALALGDAARVAPLDKLSVVLVAVLGVLLLGESLTLPNWLGVLLIVAGAMLVAYRG